jgi:hypothetical protein
MELPQNMYAKSHKNRTSTRGTATSPLGFAIACLRMPEAPNRMMSQGLRCRGRTSRAPLGSHLRRASRSGSRCRCASGSWNCRRRATRSGIHRRATGDMPPSCRRIREPLSLRLQIEETQSSRLWIGEPPPSRLRIWDRSSVARPEATAASRSRGTATVTCA